MTLRNYGFRGLIGGLAPLFLALLFLMTPAGAQENLDQGKSPAQLFASDCAICHKTPQGLAKSAGVFGLDRFLQEHYTASHEAAAAISKYLQAAGDAPAPTKRGAQAAKGSKDKKSAKKPGEAKSESKTESKAETKSEAKKDGKNAKSEAKTEVKGEPKLELIKPEPKPESKAETKSEPKDKPKGETRSEAKTKSKSKPEPDAASKPSDSAKPDKSD
jgi:hypothetical protein